MPATGKSMKVGDITESDPNIHAGVKFLRAMMNEYYANEPMERLNKGLFTFVRLQRGTRRATSRLVLRDPGIELRTTNEDFATDAIAGKSLVRRKIQVLPQGAKAESGIG
jgi:hypothetical protein